MPSSNDLSTRATADHLSGRVSVVIPVYRGEQTLTAVVEETLDVLERIAEDHEIVLVNDGSPDGSWELITSLARRHDRVRGISLLRNFGQHNATLAGIRDARFEVVVTLDDDLQHPPAVIADLVLKLREGFDVVYATPRQPAHGFWRGLVTFLTKRALQTAMGTDAARHVSPFRAFRQDLRGVFAGYTGPHVSVDVLLSWGASKYGFVTFEHRPRAAGTSNYTVRSLASYAITMMTGFSTRPLRLASVTGFCFASLGLVVLSAVVVRRIFQGNPVPGFPFLASMIAIFSGAQLFALGIIGEYLAGMHFRLMHRPPYAIRETYEGSDDT